MKDLVNLNMRGHIVFTTVVNRVAQEFLQVAYFFRCLNKTSDTDEKNDCIHTVRSLTHICHSPNILSKPLNPTEGESVFIGFGVILKNRTEANKYMRFLFLKISAL